MLDMRSYRGRTRGKPGDLRPRGLFSRSDQVAWLKRELMNSRATWKVIAADMPLSLIVVYDNDRKWGVEAIAQATVRRAGASSRSGHPVLHQHAGVRKRACFTADVHYCAAHRYDPARHSSRLRAVLGVRHRPHSCRRVRAERLDNTFGPQIATCPKN